MSIKITWAEPIACRMSKVDRYDGPWRFADTCEYPMLLIAVRVTTEGNGKVSALVERVVYRDVLYDHSQWIKSQMIREACNGLAEHIISKHQKLPEEWRPNLKELQLYNHQDAQGSGYRTPLHT